MRLIPLLTGWIGLLALVLAPAWTRAAEPLALGVPPVHPTRVLVNRYEPMRAYLQQRLGRPAQVQSAADFRQYHQRALRGDFDLTVIPAHLARLAQKDQGLVPLAQFHPDHDFLLLTRRDRPLSDLEALRGERLAVIDPLAITVMAAQQYLEGRGLRAGRDYRVIPYRTHASVIHALLGGEAMAAVSTSQGLMQIPDPERARLQTLGGGGTVPAFVVMARSDSTPAQREHYRQVLLAFTDTPEGLEFFAQTGYQSLRPVSEAQMARVDPYLDETRRLLEP